MLTSSWRAYSRSGYCPNYSSEQISELVVAGLLSSRFGQYWTWCSLRTHSIGGEHGSAEKTNSNTERKGGSKREGPPELQSCAGKSGEAARSQANAKKAFDEG